MYESDQKKRFSVCIVNGSCPTAFAQVMTGKRLLRIVLLSGRRWLSTSPMEHTLITDSASRAFHSARPLAQTPLAPSLPAPGGDTAVPAKSGTRHYPESEPQPPPAHAARPPACP